MSIRSFTHSHLGQFAIAIVIAMAASVGLFVYRAQETHSLAYSYLLWNLVLAALPLVFSLRLVAVLMHKRWSDWEPIGWTLLWIIFLPNSFYMVSDYIHLRGVAADSILYIAVMFTAYIFLGLVLGMCSLFVVHRALWRRMSGGAAATLVGLLLVLCSFAIYIGRDLRWNSWDIIFNPGGLLFDITDRLLHPDSYTGMLLTMGSFFVLLASTYMVVWAGANLLHPPRQRHH